MENRFSPLKLMLYLRDTVNTFAQQAIEESTFCCSAPLLTFNEEILSLELFRPFIQIPSLANDFVTQLLLYVDQDVSDYLNWNILVLT